MMLLVGDVKSFDVMGGVRPNEFTQRSEQGIFGEVRNVQHEKIKELVLLVADIVCEVLVCHLFGAPYDYKPVMG